MAYLSARIDPQNARPLHYKTAYREKVAYDTCKVLMRSLPVKLEEKGEDFNFTLRNEFCRSPDFTNYRIEGDKANFAQLITGILEESGYELRCLPGSPQTVLYLRARLILPDPNPAQPVFFSRAIG